MGLFVQSKEGTRSFLENWIKVQYYGSRNSIRAQIREAQGVGIALSSGGVGISFK